MAWSREVFAKNLRYYMESRGKTQKELSEIVGVSAPTVNEWLKAKKYPRIDKIEILSDYFGILKSDLIEDKPKESNAKNEMTIGDLFGYLRRQRNLSIAEFAEEIGLTEDDVQKYETGKGGIPSEIVKMLAEYFDISVGKLKAGKVKGNDIFAAFASTNEKYVEQVTKWVEVFGNERFSNEEFEKIIEYAKFILYQRQNKN